MALKISKVEVWAGDIRDQAGGLADALAPLGKAAGELECVIARRRDEPSGSGAVFVSPIKGKRMQDAAQNAGLSRAADIGTLRVEGPDRPGLGAQLTRAIADAGISMRGVSAMVLGNRFVAYLGFDSSADADQAAKALKSADKPAARSRKPSRSKRRR